MPIGTETPGSPTLVTPDTTPTPYTAGVYGPAPDGEIIADDVLSVLLVALNIEKRHDGILGPAGSRLAFLINIAGSANYQTGQVSFGSSGADWTYYRDDTGGISLLGAWRTTASEYAALRWYQELDVPNGVTLTGLTAKVRGSAAIAGPGLPAGNAAFLALHVVQMNSGARISNLTTSKTDDPSATLSDYKAIHDIVHTEGTPYTVDRSAYRYIAEVKMHQNEDAGFMVYGIKPTITYTW
jgi:hypothetical protein